MALVDYQNSMFLPLGLEHIIIVKTLCGQFLFIGEESYMLIISPEIDIVSQ